MRDSTPLTENRRELTDAELLPPGPGLLPRWLVAVPLMLLASVLPSFGELSLSSWVSVSIHETLDMFDSGPAPTFWGELRHEIGTFTPVLMLPGIALLIFLLRRDMFAAWPKTCLWLGAWVLGPVTIFGAVIDAGHTFLPNLALGVGIIWLTYELGVLTLWVLSRPVALDLVRSRLEIPYQVPGSRARLRIRRDHVRLDRLKGARGSARRIIRWPQLREARLDELTEPTTWKAGLTEIEVPAGPVLRITGGDAEWVLPVTEAMGEDLAAAITLRAHNRT